MGLLISWSTERTFRSAEGGDILNEATEQMELDILESEDLSYAGSITTKVIEDSAFINEHFQREPISLRCNCVHTDSPPPEKDEAVTVRSVTIGETEVVMGRLSAEYEDDDVFTIERDHRTSVTAAVLEELFVNGVEVILDGVRVFNKTWVITSLDYRRNPGNNGALFISLTFTEVRKGQVEETEAPSIERARRRKDTGRGGYHAGKVFGKQEVEDNEPPEPPPEPPRMRGGLENRSGAPSMSGGRWRRERF